MWYDRELVTGDRWADVIQERIETCSALLVIMTPRAEGSAWVNREISQAEALGKPIIPLLLEGDAFFRLTGIQFDDVSGGAMPSLGMVSRLRALTDSPDVPTDPVSTPVIPPVAEPGPVNVFINYRRLDAEFPAYALFRLLTSPDTPHALATDSVYIDVNRLYVGDLFRQEVELAIQKCRVMVTIIGPHWLTLRNKKDQVRLFTPRDVVRKEIELALKYRLVIMPVLLGSTVAPEEDELPESIVDLAERHMFPLSASDFDQGAAEIAARIHTVLAREAPKRDLTVGSVDL